jgi:hypothetical protein
LFLHQKGMLVCVPLDKVHETKIGFIVNLVEIVSQKVF